MVVVAPHIDLVVLDRAGPLLALNSRSLASLLDLLIELVVLIVLGLLLSIFFIVVFFLELLLLLHLIVYFHNF